MKECGPRAFPAYDPDSGTMISAGMSLRDWLAGQAMQGQLASADPNDWVSPQALAKSSYEIADAMLAERDK